VGEKCGDQILLLWRDGEGGGDFKVQEDKRVKLAMGRIAVEDCKKYILQ